MSVDEDKRLQIMSDKEAEFNAANEAIKHRYEEESKKEGSDIKALAEAQTKELEELGTDYQELKDQLDSLVKLQLISETDYRALPDELRELIKVGMGGSALKELLVGIDLNELIAELSKEAEEAKGQRKKKS